MKKREPIVKNYLFDALFDILKKENYNNFSVCDICKKAGVSRMSFYRNFKSKDDLTLKFIDSILEQARKTIIKNENRNQYTYVSTLFSTINEYKSIYPSLKDTEILKQFANNIMQHIIDVSPEDKFNKTSKYCFIYYAGGISSVIVAWLKNNCDESAEEMARFVCSTSNITLEDETISNL